MGRTAIEISREVLCTSEPSALWPLLSDTNRLNQATGLSEIVATPLAEGEAGLDSSAARYRVSTRLGGFLAEYDELPFEWVENQQLSVRRVMRGGPVSELHFRLQLQAVGVGVTRVQLGLTLKPRFRLVAMIARQSGERTLARLAREVRHTDALLRKRRAELRSGVSTTGSKALAGPLERALVDLRNRVPSSEHGLVERFRDLVSTAEDSELARIRPFECADLWGAHRRQVLTVALEAVQAGLLELFWDVVCPSCRTSSDRVSSLSELQSHGRCQLCDLGFEVSFDRQVEATFQPAPSVRKVAEQLFCIGGPARTPHVFAQVVATPHREILIPAPLERGTYRLFARGGSIVPVVVEPVAPHETEVRIGESTQAEPVRVAPRGWLKLHLLGSEDRHVKLERLDWLDRAATAHHVALLPAFRRLFSHDVLRPEVRLKVARIALLFTDLSGSTALYAREGDAGAYALVQDHFTLLEKVIGAREGAVVKTMGDAVMAAFEDEEQAFRAGQEALRAFDHLRKERAFSPSVGLKVGVFAGPGFVVTIKDRLDYFGQTVNLAARLQSAAEAGELVVAQSLAETAQAEGWLQPGSVVSAFDAQLKGLPGPFKAARIHVP